MGGGLEVDLSQGAVPALWSAAWPEWPNGGPVLQVADVTHVPDGTGLRPSPAQYQRYRLLLSDGVYSTRATLSRGLNHLVRGHDLRRGSVVRVHGFHLASDPDHVRTIVITQLQILQTECALIGSLKRYKPARNSGVSSTSRSMSYGLSSGMGPALWEKTPVWKLVGQIKDEYLGSSYKLDLITVKATISSVTELLYQVICPLVVNGKQCNAKATDVDGTWRCDRCGYTFREPCKYGCSVRIQIQDHTGTASATAYEETAEDILGCRSKDLYSIMYEQHDHAQLGDIKRRAVGKQYVFQLEVEQQVSSAVECFVLKVEKVSPSAESRRLLGQINMQEGSGPGWEIHSPTMPTYTGSYHAAALRQFSDSQGLFGWL